MTEVLCCQIGSHLVTFLAGGPPLKVGSRPPKNGKEPSPIDHSILFSLKPLNETKKIEANLHGWLLPKTSPDPLPMDIHFFPTGLNHLRLIVATDCGGGVGPLSALAELGVECRHIFACESDPSRPFGWWVVRMLDFLGMLRFFMTENMSMAGLQSSWVFFYNGKCFWNALKCYFPWHGMLCWWLDSK